MDMTTLLSGDTEKTTDSEGKVFNPLMHFDIDDAVL
jgi:hypothetical protein